MSARPGKSSLERAIVRWEEEILRLTANTSERFVALDMAGEFVHAKAGEADRVELTDEDIAQLRGRDLVLLHNLPVAAV